MRWSEYQTDYLQQALTAGWLPPEFLVGNISSEHWYHAMVGLATRLRDPETLLEVVAGMGHGIGPPRTAASPLVIGLGQTGIAVIEMLSTMATIGQESLLAVDFDRYTLEQCAVSRKLAVPFGRVRFLGWAGVHHGGVDHRRLLSIAAVPELAKEFENASRVIVTLALGGAFGTAAAPVIAALSQNLVRRLQVVAILPLRLRHVKAKNDPLHWRESLHALELLKRLGARVELLSSEQILEESRKGGQGLSLRDFHKLMIAAVLGHVVAEVDDNIHDSR